MCGHHVSMRLTDASVASAYAQRLLASLSCSHSLRDLGSTAEHPAVSWLRSGMAELTGPRDGPALMAPASLTACADGALAALQALAPPGCLEGLRGSALLGERSRLAGLRRGGSVSPGEGCRLLPTADGVVAVSLVRKSDWESVAAWLGEAQFDWNGVRDQIANFSTAALVEQAHLVGLAVSAAAPSSTNAHAWFCTVKSVPPGRRRRPLPLVVDLSSLWAGPLCTDLLGRLGAEVLKIESVSRPDGARGGHPGFFTRLNSGKLSVALDFREPTGRAALLSLIEAADIVVESSRPRALRQLGIDAESILDRNPGLSWIALSGYGRRSPQDQWCAYGDDAAAAAGLCNLMHDIYGSWLLCGDAIADPLTGMHAALLAWASWLQGGGVLRSVALCDVVSYVIAADGPLDIASRCQRTREWQRIAASLTDRTQYPLPVARRKMQAFGASTTDVLKGSIHDRVDQTP
jgi:hypothetical protein